jgi:hypothetical protein
MSPNTNRPLWLIASEIRKDWLEPEMSAWPYLSAMSQLNNSYDLFGMTRGRQIIDEFLKHARGWKGIVARRVKSELRGMI